nr:hypothetical protein [Tanacetum cinerariifolium]
IALSAVPPTLLFWKALVDKVLMLRVQHQVLNQFEIPLVKSEEDPTSPQEIPQENFELLVDGVILIWELNAVDTKLLSAPVSNKTKAYRLFRRNVPVMTLASGFVPSTLVTMVVVVPQLWTFSLKMSLNSTLITCRFFGKHPPAQQSQFLKALELWLSSPFVLLRASRAAKAAVTPWSIIACSWALVTDVVLVVSWSAIDLVVHFGAIFF